MKNKEEIVEILQRELGFVYCDTCTHEDKNEDACDWCHRKSMNWSLSDSAAEKIAEKICN